MLTKSQNRERRLQKLMADCKHFTGIQHEQCEAGVELRRLVGGPELGWACRLPCITISTSANTVACEQRQALTREEAEQELERLDQQALAAAKAYDAVKADARANGLGEGKGGCGTVKCPNCDGVIRYSVARLNGHTAAKCSNGCVAWME